MPTTEMRYHRLHMAAFGWGLSIALAVSFVLCELAAMAFPDLHATHAWVGLFTAEQMGSPLSFVQGVGASLVFGWVFAAILVVVYNLLSGALSHCHSRSLVTALPVSLSSRRFRIADLP